MIATMKNNLMATILAAVVATGIAISGVLGFGLANAQGTNPVDISSDACTTAGEIIADVDCDSADTEGEVSDTISSLARTIIRWLTIAVMAICIIFIIVGGAKYVTSGGAQEKVTSAKNTILYAVIGMVIVLLANTILSLVIDTANTIDDAGGSNTTDENGNTTGGDLDG